MLHVCKMCPHTIFKWGLKSHRDSFSEKTRKSVFPLFFSKKMYMFYLQLSLWEVFLTWVRWIPIWQTASCSASEMRLPWIRRTEVIFRESLKRNGGTCKIKMCVNLYDRHTFNHNEFIFIFCDALIQKLILW